MVKFSSNKWNSEQVRFLVLFGKVSVNGKEKGPHQGRQCTWLPLFRSFVSDRLPSYTYILITSQVNFMWTHRLASMGKDRHGRRFSKMPAAAPSSRTLRRESSYLRRTVDQHAIGGVGLSEFEIVRVRVESDEKDVNSMQRYDHTEGAFSEAHLIIRVRRDPYSYLLRVASVSELLMFLEALSFLTDSSDLSARFSISGTIFLAMVSLYGPMADALPKVSVVTRVDKW